MSDAQTLPQQIIEMSKAFTETLTLENQVFQGQLNGAIEMTLNSFRGLIELCQEAIAIGKTGTAKDEKSLADTVQQALSKVQNAASPATTSPAPATGPTLDEKWDTAVLFAVSQSYENAVQAQQQMYVSQQAAATLIISTVANLVTTTLGLSIEKAERGGK